MQKKVRSGGKHSQKTENYKLNKEEEDETINQYKNHA